MVRRALPCILARAALTELDEQLAVAPALVWGQRQDTGHVVVLRGFLLLGNKGCEHSGVGTEQTKLGSPRTPTLEK